MEEKREPFFIAEEKRKEQRRKKALAFLEICKGDGLTIYEIEKTIEIMQLLLKHNVSLDCGLNL